MEDPVVLSFSKLWKCGWDGLTWAYRGTPYTPTFPKPSTAYPINAFYIKFTPTVSRGNLLKWIEFLNRSQATCYPQKGKVRLETSNFRHSTGQCFRPDSFHNLHKWYAQICRVSDETFCRWCKNIYCNRVYSRYLNHTGWHKQVINGQKPDNYH